MALSHESSFICFSNHCSTVQQTLSLTLTQSPNESVSITLVTDILSSYSIWKASLTNLSVCVTSKDRTVTVSFFIFRRLLHVISYS